VAVTPSEPSSIVREEPFVDLPASLVEELLDKSALVSDSLLGSFSALRESRADLRGALVSSDLLLRDAELEHPHMPTTCAVDGSYAIERLLATDLAAFAAVAVEGLTPPSETRHWDRPHHTAFIEPEPHNADTATVLRAVMLGNELKLAVKAPHDLVMLDQTLTLPVIYLNQALSKFVEVDELACAREFQDKAPQFLESYLEILQSQRSDRNYVGVPKYSTRREIGRRLGWPKGHDDRGLLSLLLEAGELTVPLALEQPEQPWHLTTAHMPQATRVVADQIIAALGSVRVFYYKPHAWLPALRLEISESSAENRYRLAAVVHGVKLQCIAAGMLEPYPLYLADRTVKALSKSLPAFRQVATQRVAERYGGDIGDIFFALHGYRTEGGR
jgi:hypothetical protein